MIAYPHMQKNIAVIIPTYNAGNTVVELIQSILSNVKSSLVFIVDDSSPDGTAHRVRNHFSKNKRVILIVRKEKAGRGSAVIRGFQEALKLPAITHVIEMDADLCHDPAVIPALIAATNRADVVIASRYVQGSKTINWKWNRQIFSRLVSLFLKATLNIPILDYTNGFRCYTRGALESIHFGNIKSKGFIVLSELAYAIHKNGGRFTEIPFTFQLYELNLSNLKFNEIKEATVTIFRLLAAGK